MTESLDLRKANRFFPHIILIGIGIGSANYFMNGGLNYLQWIIMSICTSLLIGFPLMVVAVNKIWFTNWLRTNWKLYIILGLGFFIVGILATEIEQAIRTLIFQIGSFAPFTSGNMYLFNGILSIVLGFSFFTIVGHSAHKPALNNFSKHNGDLKDDAVPGNTNSNNTIITNIPAKQGDSILLIPIGSVVYFEAFDNYAFVHDMEGKKRLCDYSLSFLEKRLDDNFSRVHRKYIVNAHQIKQIKPHLNGRYIVEFSNKSLAPIHTSKTYGPVIRKLIKIR